MTAQDVVRVVRSRWKFICGTIAIVVLAAFAYAFLITPQYQASTRLFVSTTSDGTNSQTYDGGLFAERRVLSYNELVMGEALAQRTIDKLGLDMSADELRGKVEANVPTETVLIDVTVTDSSPTRARDIANALADEFVVMAAALETPQPGAAPNARVIVQERAQVPGSPMNAKTTRTLAVAAVLGALIAVAGALLWDRVDDSVRSADALERATGVGVLGEIPVDSDRSSLANAFRELRVNLRFLEAGNGPRALLIASGRPGEGRTTTAVNLATALAEAGHSVVIVDGDLRRPGVASSLALPGRAGLSNVLSGEVPLQQALQETRVPRLTALTSGAVPDNPADLLESPSTREVLGELGGRFDYVIVDSPALSVADAVLLAESCQGSLLVARFGKTKRKQLVDSVHSLTRAATPLLGSVLTMTKKKQPSGDSYDTTARAAHRGSHEK